MADDPCSNEPQGDDHEPPTPAATAPMTGPEALEAMRAYQRSAAEQMRTRQAEKDESRAQAANTAASPTPAPGAFDNGFSEIVQTKQDKGAKEFARLKRKYLERQEAGKATMDEDIAFLRAESAEKARQRKIKQDAEFENPFLLSDDEGLFFGENPSIVPDVPGLESEDEEPQPKKRGRKRKSDGNGDERPAKHAKKPRKVAGQRYTQDDDLEAQRDQLESAKKAKKTPAKPASKNKKRPSAGGPSMTNLNTLYGHDVFRDAAATQNLPDQPTFEGDFSMRKGRRDEAMKKLIASVPTESRDVAKNDQKFLDAAIKDFTGGGNSVKATADGNWTVKGMKTTLKHYQIMGTAFMRRRENGSELPRGGIHADAMGLGKTLMTLANIVNGKPKGPGKSLRTTLIVASPALVNQWFSEIQKHCYRRSENKEHGIGAVYQHRAGHRLDSNLNTENLENADIILTTYSEVNRSYPKAEVPKELTTAKQKDEWWRRHFEENKGILHQLKYLRVVLDEAQQIKNHKSVTSMACRSLKARHHWALTGTPIYNTVSEFYSIFKFLQEPHTGTFKIFKANFCDPSDPDCLEKLNVFLRKLMVRRTHMDRLFGARLLNLPKPTEKTLKLEFSEIERSVYDIVKTRMINRINKIAKVEGPSGLLKKYSHIWTMILRLRQLCGHVLLIQGTIMDILEREDFEKLNRLANAEQEMNDEGSAILVHLKQVLSSRAGLTTVEGANGATISEHQILATGTVDIGDVDDDVGGNHGLSFRFKKYLKTLAGSDKWTEITQRSCCSGCRQPAVDPYISDCFHIYCHQCLVDLQHLAARRGQDQARCAECGNHYSNAQPCEGLEELANGSLESSPADPLVTATKKGKKDKKESVEDWIDIGGDVLPSAKTRAAKAQILVWLEEDPNAKIIVYTQFLPMVKILEKVCRSECWATCKYTGNMSQDARNNSVNEFAENPEKKILLASLKCGGLGLNLTMASRVLLLDPWWQVPMEAQIQCGTFADKYARNHRNSAVEQQAFARVYRIGQVRETQLTRLVINNSVDAAMVAAKERKDLQIERVVRSSHKQEALDVQELMRLFGEVGEDGEGKPFIFPQSSPQYDEEEPEHLRYAADDVEDEAAFMGNEE